MKIHINDHIDGNARLDPRLAEPVFGGVRSAAARADRHLGRLRGRLDQPRRVLVRDFVIFECKLFLDWLKGPIIAQLALIGFVIDLVRPGGRSFGIFYKVMSIGERLDIWLSLYGPSRRAAEDPEGLMGQSREGSPTLLGQLERLVHRLVVGDDALDSGDELYPRYAGEPAREPAAPPPGASGAAPAPPPAGAAPPRPAPAPPAAGASPPPGASGPERRSSFEVENFGQ